jgi:glycosyltransferase involved in cell wall biosynthesis
MPQYSEAHSKIRAFGWFLFPWRIMKLARVIPDAPDVVVCSSPSLISFLAAKKLSSRFRARLVFEVRDIWPLTLTELGGYRAKHPFIRFMQWIEDKAYHDSSSVISNLNGSVEHMVNRGMRREKFAWVPNGFSLDEVNLNAPLNLKAVEQLPKDGFIVGYAGTIGLANSLETLIEAADLLRQNSGIAFVLVGAGKEKIKLKKMITDRRLSNVYFIDPIPKPEIQPMLAKFDVCYIGWLDDPLYDFGIGANKIPEYFYAAKPVIHSYSGAHDPITEAGAGIQVPAQDAQELASAVLKLYEMPESERREMGNNGRKAALEQYEYSRLAQKYRDVLFGGEST